MNHASHEFQSITREQRESGVDRHECRLCKRDYGDPIHCVSSWPLVVVIEDCYVPEWAGKIVEYTRKIPVDHFYAVIHALAVYEELLLTGNRLN